MQEKRKVKEKSRTPVVEIPTVSDLGNMALIPRLQPNRADETIEDVQKLNLSGDANKWVASRINYASSVSIELSKEQEKALFAEFKESDYLVHPVIGNIYIPAAILRDRFNRAFGALRWRALPIITPDGPYIFRENLVYVVSGLFLQSGKTKEGVCVDIAVGCGKYIASNEMSNLAHSCEMASTYAFKAHCNHLGITTANRTPEFFEEFKRRNCVQVWVNESAGTALRWRRNWDAPFLGEIGTLAEVRLGSKEGDKIPLEKASGAMKHANVRPTTRTVKDTPTLTRGQIEDVLATMERFSMPLDEVLSLARAKYAAAEIRQVPQASFQEFLNAITLSGMRRKYFSSKEAAEKFEALQTAFVESKLDVLEAFKAAFKNLALKDLSELADHEVAEVVKAAKGGAKS